MTTHYPNYVNGQWHPQGQEHPVTNPYNGEAVGNAYAAPSQLLEEAIAGSAHTFQIMRKLSSGNRSAALVKIHDGLRARKDELAKLIAQEAGKPLRDAIGEVDRALLTFQTAAEEAKRIGGEIMPLDLLPTSLDRWGLIRRFPLGPVLAITPFNFPLNLAAHKIAPAIAAGNSVLLKVPPQTPLTMLTVAQIIADSGLPAGAVNILLVDPALHDQLVTDDRFKLLTFTGSTAVGWALKAKAGKKRVLLELGGNAGVIVDGDADLDHAVTRIAAGGFSFAGQSCISVQRTYVHESIFGGFQEKLLARVNDMRLGDPLDQDTDLGPMISPQAVTRTEQWVQEAVAAGARVLCGGKAQGNIFEPTLISGADAKSKVCSEEVFAPLITLFPFQDFRQAVAAVNDSAYGLQAGVFSNNLRNVWYAFEELEVGGVTVNEVPTWRLDPMPYGGIKDSGLGREGLRYAIEEMTELKILVLRP